MGICGDAPQREAAGRVSTNAITCRRPSRTRPALFPFVDALTVSDDTEDRVQPPVRAGGTDLGDDKRVEAFAPP